MLNLKTLSKMKKFRFLSLLLAATLMSVSFSACGGTEDPNQDPDPTPEKEELTLENYVEFLKKNGNLDLKPTATMTANKVNTFLYPYGVNFATENALEDARTIGEDLFAQTAAQDTSGSNHNIDMDLETYRTFRTENIKSFDDALMYSVGDNYKNWIWYYTKIYKVTDYGTIYYTRCEVSITADADKNYVTLQIDYD